MDRRESEAAARNRFAGSSVLGPRWLASLAEAKTEAELIRTCRRYLVSIKPLELSRLPLTCRPIPLEDAADLSAYALQLVRYHCEVEDASPLVLHMAAFFAHANVRMAKILRRMNDDLDADTILAGIGHAPGPTDAGPVASGREGPNTGSGPE